MRSSHDRPRNIRFCLDANISPRAAAGIDNVVHVSEVDALSRTHGGHSNADDYDIAVWCVDNGYVLVTLRQRLPIPTAAGAVDPAGWSRSSRVDL